MMFPGVNVIAATGNVLRLSGVMIADEHIIRAGDVCPSGRDHEESRCCHPRGGGDRRWGRCLWSAPTSWWWDVVQPELFGLVPNASDVNLAGGSGNSPAYVSGPVQVIGPDVYGLDAGRRRCRLRVVGVDAENPTVGLAATRGR